MDTTSTLSVVLTPSAPAEAELRQLDAYWRTANYLAAGMLYLKDNPLLREPLRPEHIKNRLLGHWGSSPGQTFIWTHANRLINAYDVDMIYMAGPGHGAPGMRGPVYVDGSYSERYPDKSLDEAGLRRFFKMFSFPGHIGSHCTAETPGSIHEGGELGHVLSHACGSIFDNPKLITVACVGVGDGEAETGPLATSWHINKFINPVRDGAVLPVLHLNGYKSANPSILSRIPHEELQSLLRGYGWAPLFVEGCDPMTMHRQMAVAMEQAVLTIRAIQEQARSNHKATRPLWPMVVLRSPKGWSGPAEVDGKKLENFWRSHQVPITEAKTNPEHLRLLEEWLKSYRPWELFDEEGAIRADIRALSPKGDRRMGSNPHTNGGVLRRNLQFPNLNDYAVTVNCPGCRESENTVPLGELIQDLMRQNPGAYRLFGPDDTASNHLLAVFETGKKVWMADYLPEDLNGSELARDGSVVEMLSEHTLVGMLEGYLLTGRHGIFHTDEAFAPVIASMFNQHCKWLERCQDVPWREPIGAWNCLVSSTIWRQEHNGCSHQDPSFLDLASNQKGSIARVYLPADANCLLAVAEQALQDTDVANVIVSDKQKHLQYLTLEQARHHVAKGASLWQWACNDDCDSELNEPDVVLASAGDIPTKECIAAIELIRERIPFLKVRYVNVVKLFALASPEDHAHGLSDLDFTTLFTPDKPIIFNFHGYPWLVHRLTYNRPNHSNLHVHGYQEQSDINTPLELAMMNKIDRFHLVIDVINRVPKLGSRAAHVKEQMKEEILRHRAYAYEHGTDAPEINNWRWGLGHSSCIV
ncbi:MAG: phosphoketolase [Synechococcus sp.]